MKNQDKIAKYNFHSTTWDDQPMTRSNQFRIRSKVTIEEHSKKGLRLFLHKI